MMLAMVVVVAVQGQRTRLVAEPIWLDDRLGSYNALVNSGLQRGVQGELDTVNHRNKGKTSAENGN